MSAVNYLTEGDIRRAHEEGRLRIPLSEALSAFTENNDTVLMRCIQPTKEQQDASVRYTAPEIMQIMKYIAALLPKLPAQLQKHTIVEAEFCQRIPFILGLNPYIKRFQCGYPGIFLCTVRSMSSPTEMEAALTQTKMLLSCLLYTSPSPRDGLLSRMPSSA